MTRLAPLLGLLCVLGSPTAVVADAGATSAPHADLGWELSFTPYLWAAGLEGTLDAEHVSSDIDVSFSDIWDALDVGVLAAVEARNGRLSVVSNLIYLKLSDETDGATGGLLPAAPPGSFEVRSTTEEIIFELRPTWEVLSLPLFGAGDERRIALDLGPGLRAFWLNSHLHVRLEPGVPLGPFSRRFDQRTSWADLVAAARVRVQLTEKLAFVVAGDYGGFDIGSSSHRTWSLHGYGSYRLGEHWDFVAGWRTLEIERGAVDLEMAGPLVGASYRF